MPKIQVTLTGEKLPDQKVYPKCKEIRDMKKYFLKVSPLQTEIDDFKSKMVSLINHINKDETEEYHKNLIATFLNDTYYKPEYYINIKDRKDLVIHIGAKKNSKVGVIIETKNPTK